jgi:hypothetical protein
MLEPTTSPAGLIPRAWLKFPPSVHASRAAERTVGGSVTPEDRRTLDVVWGVFVNRPK